MINQFLGPVSLLPSNVLGGEMRKSNSFKKKNHKQYIVGKSDKEDVLMHSLTPVFSPHSRPDHLNGHIKQVHTTERPHKCQVTFGIYILKWS